MSVTGPMVRDYTEAKGGLRVEIDVSPAYELILSLFTFGCSDRDDYEVGPTWFQEAYDQGSAELKAGLDLFASAGELLVGLLGIVYDLPAPKTVDALLAHLEAMDPVTLRMDMLRCCAPGVTDGELAAIAGGDGELLGRFLEANGVVKHQSAIDAVLSAEADDFRDILVTTMRRFAEERLGDTSDLMAVLRRDAVEKRAMASTRTPERVVELATNGVTFAPQPDVAGVVLVPSIVVRPWVVIAEHRGLRIFAYPVTDEAMSADPGAPSPWMVAFFKALGDERRLRILGILTDGPAGLGDIAEHIGVSKSTVHHHISILRQAGMVRVTVGADKEYSLRTEAVPHANAMLAAYLGERT